MQILDNVRNTVKDDLQVTIKKGSKISVTEKAIGSCRGTSLYFYFTNLLKRKNAQGKPGVLYFPDEPGAQHLRNRI